MTKQQIYQVDAFTSEPFTGNPAAVCILETEPDTLWMQAVAAEMNLAETAFTWKKGENFQLKWFTPEKEVQLCGHATLATTWILYQKELIKENQQVIFETLSGNLYCKVQNNTILMDFPAIHTDDIEVTPEIKEAVKAEVVAVSESKNGYLIIELKNSIDIKNLNPDNESLIKLGEKIIIITSGNDSKYDMVSRVFAPAFGIQEDSVTGSAHCALTPYFANKTSKKSFSAYQASKRGGLLFTTLDENNRILLSGKAVTVMEGHLFF